MLRSHRSLILSPKKKGLAGKTFPLGARTVRGQAVMYTVQGVKTQSGHAAHITVFFGDAAEHAKY
jgi:hypothetical protein